MLLIIFLGFILLLFVVAYFAEKHAKYKQNRLELERENE